MRSLSPLATPNLGLVPGTTRNEVLLVCGEDLDLVQSLLRRLGVSFGDSIHHREFHTVGCSAQGRTFTCCVTGLGSASVEVALNELFHTGGRVFIHSGTAATLGHARLPVGTPAIIDYAWRDDGASLQYVGGSRRRVDAHPALLKALWQAAHRRGVTARTGVGLSTDGFYACAAILRGSAVVPATLFEIRDRLVPIGFSEWLVPLLEGHEPYCLDMEVGTFYTLAELIEPAAGVRWASIKGIANEIPFKAGQQNEFTESALEAALQVAVAALTES